MLGGMLAGHDECGGQTVQVEGKQASHATQLSDPVRVFRRVMHVARQPAHIKAAM